MGKMGRRDKCSEILVRHRYCAGRRMVFIVKKLILLHV